MVRKATKHIFSASFLRYFISGVTAFSVDNIILNLLKFSGFNLQLFGFIYFAKVISSTVGVIVSFVLNRYWSFKATEVKVKPQAIKMFYTFVFNIFLGALLYSIYFEIIQLQSFFSFGDFAPTLANIVATGTQMFITFFIYKFYVFKV